MNLQDPSLLTLMVWIMSAVISVIASILGFFVMRFIAKSDQKFEKLFEVLGGHKIKIAVHEEKIHHHDLNIVRLQKQMEAK